MPLGKLYVIVTLGRMAGGAWESKKLRACGLLQVEQYRDTMTLNEHLMYTQHRTRGACGCHTKENKYRQTRVPLHGPQFVGEGYGVVVRILIAGYRSHIHE